MARRSVLAWVSLCLLVVVGCGGGSGSTGPPPPPDFSITIHPASLSLLLGTSSQVQINESSLNGFKGTVSLNARSLPAGGTISPALPQNVGPSGTRLSLAVAAQ